MRKMSDQDRLWYERSPEKQPIAPYVYPTDGYEYVLLRRQDDAALYQINDYRSRRKLYIVLDGANIATATMDRSLADMRYTVAASFRTEEGEYADSGRVFGGIQEAI